jgi:hypothetical protein
MADNEANQRKALAAFDWLVRVYAPAFLRLAKLDDQAAILERLPKILTMDQRTDVYVQTRDIREDIRKLRLELQRTENSNPVTPEEEDPIKGLIAYRKITRGLPDDHVWKIVVKAFVEAEILGMHNVASEIWCLADDAAAIAIRKAEVTAEVISEKDRDLEQQLISLLKTVA